MILNRRGLLVGLASVLAAPAIIPYASLMPVHALELPQYETIRIGGQTVTFDRKTLRIITPSWMKGRRVSPKQNVVEVDFGPPRHGEAAYHFSWYGDVPPLGRERPPINDPLLTIDWKTMQ